MKKLLSLTLSLLLVFSLIPSFAMSVSALNSDTVCVIGDKEFTSLFGKEGALNSAVAGDVIVMKANETSSSTAIVDKNITLDLAGYSLTNTAGSAVITTSADFTLRSTKDGLGEANTDAKANVKYANTFVKGSAKTSYSNSAFVTTATTNTTGSVFVSDSDAAELTVKDSTIGVDKSNTNSRGILFTGKAVKVDFENVNIKSGTYNQNFGVSFNSEVTGIFKNCRFEMQQGISVSIAKTAAEGVEFNGCTITQNAYDQNAVFQVTGGNVRLTGGTVLDGQNKSSAVLRMSGGNLTADDAVIRWDKGDSASKYAMFLSGGTLELNKTTIIKGTKGSSRLVNNNDRFIAGIKKGYAAYSSDTKNKDTVLARETNFQIQSRVVIDKCQHFETTATCLEDGKCVYCLEDIKALGHDYDEVRYNNTQHWYICSRCDGLSEAEDHKGGTATCTKKAVCSVCHQAYGEPLGHSFTDYQLVEPAPCEHNSLKKATCDRCNQAVDYDYSGFVNVTVTKGTPPTCVKSGTSDKITCSICDKVLVESKEVSATGHKYDREEIVLAPTYRKEGELKKTCSVCGNVEIEKLPKLEFKKSTVAFIEKENDVFEQYSTLLGDGGALNSAKKNDVVVLIKDVSENKNSVVQEENVTLDLAGYSLTYAGSGAAIKTDSKFTIRSTIEGYGGSNTDTKAKITYSSNIISAVSEGAEVIIENINGVTSANISIYAATVNNTKLTVLDSSLAVTNKGINAVPINFNTNAVNINFNNVSIASGSDGGGVTIARGSEGIFENCTFTKQKGLSVTVSATSKNGIEFKNCNISQSSWDQNAFRIEGGTAMLTGGTVVTGNNTASSVIVASGGTLIIDGAKITGDKGTDQNRILLNISGCNVQIKNAELVRGSSNGARGTICNNDTKLFEALAEGRALYTSTILSNEFSPKYKAAENVINEKVLYVKECVHAEVTADCEHDGVCVYCNKAFAKYGHDTDGFDSNGEIHWKTCSRCNKKVEGSEEAHIGGTATCTEPKHCEICNMAYGGLLEHDYSVVGHDDVNHWVECSLCGKKDKVQKHIAGATTQADCTHSAVCEKCKFSFGEPAGHEFIDYRANHDATCLTNETETSKCSHCDATDTREIPNSALGHHQVEIPPVPATCVSTGKTAGIACDRPGCTTPILVAPQDTPISEHHCWDNGKVTKAATCRESGVYTYTCELCSATATIEIPINHNNHSYGAYRVQKKATYFANGIEVRTCVSCKHAQTRTIPKLKLSKPKVKVSVGKGKITVKYSKTGGAKLYQVRYRLTSSKKWVTKTYKSAKAAKKSYSKLARGKKYYVQVRAGVTSGKNKAYSAWYKTTVKIK